MPRSDGASTIYLTDDDGPNPAATPALLDGLARERAIATFFVIPRRVTDDTTSSSCTTGHHTRARRAPALR
ncbi:MAG TPA: polysaccharide deacetylase family protein [Vicinamibacterales bacterium]|nr:polysaccharide deacetylase family protein [Vicinamibacterales bacterium]